VHQLAQVAVNNAPDQIEKMPNLRSRLLQTNEAVVQGHDLLGAGRLEDLVQARSLADVLDQEWEAGFDREAMK
jgi:hypothetical protein